MPPVRKSTRTPRTTEKIPPATILVNDEPTILPVIPMKDVVVFPGCISPLFVTRPKSLQALEDAVNADKRVLLVAQKSVDVDNPAAEDLYTVGAVAEILQVLKVPDNAAKVLVEGQSVARILGYANTDTTLRATYEKVEPEFEPSRETEALLRLILRQFEVHVHLFDKIPDELFVTVKNYENPVQTANAIAHFSNFKLKDKQALLEQTNLERRLLMLSQLLAAENEMLELENNIIRKVKDQISKGQKEYFLNEQLKVIERELGIGMEEDAEIEELGDKINKSKMSQEAREKVTKELSRLAKMQPMSPEATVSRTYIEWALDLPWGKTTKDKDDMLAAQAILDEEHYGLTKVKDRIIEFLAVHQLVKTMKGPILCLVGPPGVGKTSLARSIARALGRKFVRISLGGVRDEAEIRGHRRTYIGSLPGKIIQSLKKAGSMNPVFLLDEVDKMSADFRGDPASALLEVLDPEQNKTFADHYLEVDFDLSQILFVTTANSVSGIPYALLDRMEIIRLPGYTEDEKLHIAEQFLVSKQLKANGLKPKQVSVNRRALKSIINDYTREAGVRNLEREIGSVCRKIAREIVTAKKAGEKSTEILVNAQKVRTLLGPPKYRDQDFDRKPTVGVTTGLAWTEVGGEILPTEVTIMKGRGTLMLTGKLGDVMQESAKAALSYIRSRGDDLKVPKDFYKNLDIHVHIPEGAVPKDGPSAGVTMTTSMVSALTNRPVRQDIAMTGEITLRGRVLKIGGLKEKVLAAHRNHITSIILPHENEDDLEDIPKEVKKDMEFILVNTMDEVLANALVTTAAAPRPRVRTRTRTT